MPDSRASDSPTGGTSTKTLLTGPFHPELEDALLRHLAERAGADPLAETPVVVPNNLLKLRLSWLLAERTGGHTNVRFMTLKDFALQVPGGLLTGGRTGSSRALLPKRADEIIVRKTLEEGVAAGGYFEGIADRPGFAGAVLSALRDLKQAGYSVDLLVRTAASAGLLRKGRDNKLGELARIWKAYERRVAEGGWADDLDAMTAAARALEGKRGSTAAASEVPLPPVILYGFYDLNALQKRIVAACSARTDIRVYFPYVEAESFHYATRTLEWFLGLGFERTELDGAAPRDLRLPAETRIISAPGEAREAREDVRELAELLDERDVAFQDAAILLRSSDIYSDLFLDELSHVGAHPYIEAPPPLSRTRAGMSLVRLGSAARGDFPRVELMEFLSLADLESTGSGDGPLAGDWNKATILAGITSGADAWTARLKGLRRRLAEAPEDQRFATAHRHLIDPLDELIPLVELLTGSLSPVAAKTTISEFLDLLLGVFCEVTRESSERSEVLTAASEMRSLSDVAGPVTFAYFMELLRSHLDSPSRRSERFGRGGPSVLNVMAARGLRFGTVIIPGLVEKKFPATHRQDPVLLDSERERLNRARGDDPLAELAIRASAVDEERLLFRLAVESAADALILSFPRLDPADARPRVPSVFVLRALEEKTGERHDYERLEASEHVTRVPLSLRFPDERGRSLTREEFDGCSVLAALRTGDLSEISYLVQEDGPLPRRLRMEEARWGSPFFTEYDAAFTSQDAIRAVRELSGFGRGGMQEHQTVAPTTLEDYARCPFRFLMRHVLDIEPVSEPEEALALSPLERGSLYHEVLETFMRRAKAENRLPLVASDRDDLLATARRLGESEQWSLAAIRGARDLETGNLISSLALWFASELLDDSPYVPAHFEARFGGHARPGDDPELSIEDGVPFTGAGGVDLRFGGRIDRVDVTADGARARVIDYKTGKPRSKGKKVLDRGKLLQLPIYLLAAERMLKLHGAGATVETAEYLYVSGRGGPSSLTFTREELENARENLARAVGLIMGGIASGMFVAYPPDLSDCRHCDYADACGSAAVALATMKSGDPLAAFFVQDLTEIE